MGFTLILYDDFVVMLIITIPSSPPGRIMEIYQREYKERRKKKPHKQMQPPHRSQQIAEQLSILQCEKIFSTGKNDFQLERTAKIKQ